jgi:glyoxylase I family protein
MSAQPEVMPRLMGFSHIEFRSLVHPSGLAVTALTHDGTAKSDAFDEQRVGLDHLAFRVSDRDELHRSVTHFDAQT